MLEHTRSGDWVPGEQHPALERVGKAYGYLAAVPAVAVLGGTAWLLAKPTRLIGFLAVTGLLALIWTLNP